jgi:hypothetical protein
MDSSSSRCLKTFRNERDCGIADKHFIIPFTCVVVGPSQCGKSVFLHNLIKHADRVIGPNKISKFIYVTSPATELDEDLTSVKNIKILRASDKSEELESLIKPHLIENCLLLLDDLFRVANDSQFIADCFTILCHHRRINVCMTTQNIFSYRTGRHSVTINRNSKYLVLFKSPRDTSYIATLGIQLYPAQSKDFTRAYNLATKEPHSYLHIDCSQEASEEYRLKNNLFDEDFSDEGAIVYVIE